LPQKTLGAAVLSKVLLKPVPVLHFGFPTHSSRETLSNELTKKGLMRAVLLEQAALLQ
jgi:hypothetical protein